MRKEKRTSFEVYASQACIDNSERNSLSWCIWALAIIYSIPGAAHVQVDKDETRFTWRGFRYVFATPTNAARIAKNYDDGVLMKTQIIPWRDTLRDPVSVEPSRHRRPSKGAAARGKQVKKSKKKNCTPKRSSRWGGGRL